jgi:hypothetical protein
MSGEIYKYLNVDKMGEYTKKAATAVIASDKSIFLTQFFLEYKKPGIAGFFMVGVSHSSDFRT